MQGLRRKVRLLNNPQTRGNAHSKGVLFCAREDTASQAPGWGLILGGYRYG